MYECFEYTIDADCLTGSATESPYVRSRFRVWFLLQACKKSFLKGSLWNRELADLMQQSPNNLPLVCWWRAAAVGALTLLTARNISHCLTWFDVDPKLASTAAASSSASATTGSANAEEFDSGDLKRIHALAGINWSDAVARERHRDDAALAEAERALDFPVCALEFDSTTWTVENYKSNSQVVAIIQELTKLAHYLEMLKSALEMFTSTQDLENQQWAYQLMDVLLSRARLFPLAGRLIRAPDQNRELLSRSFLGTLMFNAFLTCVSFRSDHRIPFLSASMCLH